jgi:hypothetical protein
MPTARPKQKRPPREPDTPSEGSNGSNNELYAPYFRSDDLDNQEDELSSGDEDDSDNDDPDAEVDQLLSDGDESLPESTQISHMSVSTVPQKRRRGRPVGSGKKGGNDKAQGIAAARSQKERSTAAKSTQNGTSYTKKFTLGMYLILKSS